ncbi:MULTISPECIES: hypothetical protein [Enterococcus]|uniref:Uncharacterized protein n=1 Tax=Candidatus Enterococcus ferrettii TaxID=2815324 RepID=A0ABV0EJX7_9ENTE|nr:hypothetical protein [Enterococcus sp. 665A]MBO1338283.1 hypothetical protein [Enterococcus sp. 665A]
MKKNSVKFGQAALGIFGWLTGIMVLVRGTDQLLGILLTTVVCGMIASSVLTLLYPLIWEGTKLNRAWKIIISATLNLAAGSAIIGLLIPAMLMMLLPWMPAMLLLGLILHSLCSLFYPQMG